MQKEVLDKCILLSQRVKEESENISDTKTANTMEVLAEMTKGNSKEVIRLIEKSWNIERKSILITRQ